MNKDQPNNRIREEWRNKLRDFEYTNHRGQGLEDFISELLKSQREELAEKIRQYPENLIQIMPKGKLPFVVFGGKADEDEKKTIYFQAFKDILSLLKEDNLSLNQ